jgi:hypothetical protein
MSDLEEPVSGAEAAASGVDDAEDDDVASIVRVR